MAGRNAPSRASYDDDDDWFSDKAAKGPKANSKPPVGKPDPGKDNKHNLTTKPNPPGKKTNAYYSDDDDDFQGIKPVGKYSNKKPAGRGAYYDSDDDDDISYGGKNQHKTKGHYDDDSDDDWDPKKPKKAPAKPGDKKGMGGHGHDWDDDSDNDKKKGDHRINHGKKEEEEYIYLKIAVVKKDGKFDLQPLDNFNEPIPPIVRKDGSKLYTKKSPSNSPDYHNGRTPSRMDDKTLTPYDKAQRRNSYDPYTARAASPLPDLRNIRSSGYARTEDKSKNKSTSWLDTFKGSSQPAKLAPAKPNQTQQARR